MDYSELMAPRQRKLYLLAFGIQLFGFFLSWALYEEPTGDYYKSWTGPNWLQGKALLPALYCFPTASIIVIITVKETLKSMWFSQKKRGE